MLAWTSIAQLLPHIVIIRFGDVTVLEKLNYSHNLVWVRFLFCARDTVVIQNLLPSAGIPVSDRVSSTALWMPLTLSSIVVKANVDDMNRIIRGRDGGGPQIRIEQVWNISMRV